MTLAICLSLPGHGQGAPSVPTDIALQSIRGTGPAPSGRFCVGAQNSVHVELNVIGTAPTKPVPLRLVMLLADAAPAGVLVAEGSVSFATDAKSASFTFINVDVPLRLRDRGARLEVRVNHARSVAEHSLANNARVIALEDATDWNCKR